MPFTTCLALSFLCLLGPALTLGEECEKRDDDTLAMIQRHKDHSARDIGRLKSCPCSGGPCFDSAPWHQLPGVRSMNQVQDHRLRSPAAQHDPLWISDQPDLGFHGGMMGSAKVPGWTALNSTPHMYMELHEGDNWQIAQAMNFATQHNLKLLIKNTGHDWFGRSMSRGFMLWTHNIQGSQWHDAFRPANCGHSEPAVSFAAGVQFWQVFQEMKEHKRLVVTGTCATVGHVGFTLGGGYGDYSHFYGSGASNLLEAEVILPSGQQVTASECNEYSDLFKALRGGGPGFGLVTKFTYRTYPAPAVSGMIMGTVSGDMVHNLAEFFAWYKALNEQKKVKHIGGILQLQPGHVIFVNLRFVNLPAEDCQALLQQSSFFNGLTCQQAAVFNDFSDYKSSENGSKGLQPDWLKNMASSYHVGSMTRYVEPRHLETPEIRQRLSAAIVKAADLANGVTENQGGDAVLFSLNYALGGTENALRDFEKTSVNPQVRQALATVKFDWMIGRDSPHVVSHGTQVDTTTLKAFEAAKHDVDEVLGGVGGYLNEGDISEENWQEHYWGSNYPFLLEVKKKYDPNNLLTCFQCVGAETIQC